MKGKDIFVSQETQIKWNPKYEPAFEEGDVVILKKDCSSYSALSPLDSDFFKEKSAFLIIEWGFSHFFVDQNDQYLKDVEDCQWCYGEAIVENAEENLEDENDRFCGVIRVKDLREINETDIN